MKNYRVRIEAVEPRVIDADIPAENEEDAKTEALVWLDRVHPEAQEPIILYVEEI